jgi:hypothetical protein
MTLRHGYTGDVGREESREHRRGQHAWPWALESVWRAPVYFVWRITNEYIQGGARMTLPPWTVKSLRARLHRHVPKYVYGYSCD